MPCASVPLRKSIAAAPSSACARSAVRSGAASRLCAKRRFASSSSILPSQKGASATQRRSASRGSRASKRVECRAEVRGLALEPRRIALPLGERERPPRVALRQCRRLAGVVEPRACVDADRLEQAVAIAAVAVFDRDERLLDEPREHVGDLARVEVVARAHVLDRLELEAAREDRQAPEQRPLVGLEQLVAPLERRGQRLLPRRRRMAPAAQEAEAVVEARADRRRAQRAEPRGRELERERQPVEAEADAGDVLRVLLVEREARRGGGRALDEEGHGFVVAEAGAASSGCSGSGMSSEGTRKTTSPAARSGSRLVATIVSCGAARRSASDERRHSRTTGARSCRARAAAFAVRGSRSPRRPAPAPAAARTSSAVATASGTSEPSRDGSKLDERRPRFVRRLGAAGELERESRLADAARPGQREQARPPEQRLRALSARGHARRTSSPRRAARSGSRRRARPPPPRARPPAPRAPRDVHPPSRRSGSRAGAHRRRAESAAPYAAGRPHPPRVRSRPLEHVDVDLRGEREHLVAHLDRLGPERPPRDVHRLVQVVRGRRGSEVAPEHVHRLLAVEPVASARARAASRARAPSSAATPNPGRRRRRRSAANPPSNARP